MSKWPSPGMRGETQAPTTADVTPLGTVNATTLHEIRSPRRWRQDPVIAPGKIDGKVVPTAKAAEQPRALIAGVDMTAPPTPKVPDIKPVATPARAVNTSR